MNENQNNIDINSIENRIKELEDKRSPLSKKEERLVDALYGNPDDYLENEDQDYISDYEDQAQIDLHILGKEISKIDEELGTLKRNLFLKNNLNKIVANSTFNNDSDSFGRQQLAENIANLINNQKEKLSIGIIGKWGTGKTTFLNFIKKKLSDDLTIIEFDASKYDDQEQIWYSLLSSVSEKYLSIKSIKRKRLKFIASSLKKTQQESTIVVLSILTVAFFILSLAGIINSLKGYPFWSNPIVQSVLLFLSTTFGFLTFNTLKSTFDTLKKILFSNSDSLSIQFKYPDYKKLLGTRENVRRDLEIFKDIIINDNSKTKLVITVDELDRCSEQTIINFFSSIEAFIDIPDVIFIFSYNPDLVYPAVAKITPENNVSSGVAFIEKYINIFFTLPSAQSYSSYIKSLTKSIKLEDNDLNSIIMLFDNISEIKETNPREVKKLLDLSLIYHQEFIDLSYSEFTIIIILQYYFDFFNFLDNDMITNQPFELLKLQSFKIAISKEPHKNKSNTTFDEQIPNIIFEITKNILPKLNMYTINKYLKQINELIIYTK